MSELIRINANGGDPHRQANDALAALAEANKGTKPRVMIHGNAIVRLTGSSELESLSVNSMVDELSAVAQFEKGSDDNISPVVPPDRVAKILLDRDVKDLAGLQTVTRVTEVPVFVPGEDRPKLVAQPGLDPSGVYYVPATGLEDLRPPEVGQITTEDLDDAIDLLFGSEGLFCDFGFDDAASKAHALALCVLPFVRDLIPGPTPLLVVRAPDVGSGKTELVKAALYPGCGRVETGTGTDNSEEWRKKVTACLLAADPVIFLDNLAATLDSGAIAAVLTAETWKDRILGKSQMATLPIRSIWAATGNNLSLSPELARRSYGVFLDPYADGYSKKPADRSRDDYKHPDLIGWAEAERIRIVGAVLTLIAHWAEGPAQVEGGYLFLRSGDAPEESSLTKGSFERWAAVVGGVLEAAHFAGFLRNDERLRSEADDASRGKVEFFAAWGEHLGMEQMVYKALLEECKDPVSPVRESLPLELYAMRPDDLAVKLATWLRDHQGQRSDEYELVKHEGRPTRWSLRAV